ncbi:putative Sodium/calcium exchanger membrane region domain-containing protein [Seiridium cardinale]|uniref:Sodium/calcium exchanger membrane region domain-containing protein n=1 Tax=Seiridium cardinale TaxID=138064 RepID=A0ABR2X6V0_9PEZI
MLAGAEPLGKSLNVVALDGRILINKAKSRYIGKDVQTADQCAIASHASSGVNPQPTPDGLLIFKIRSPLLFIGCASQLSHLSSPLVLPSELLPTLASHLPNYYPSMKKTSTNSTPPYTDRIRSWARTHAHGGSTQPSNNTLPVANSTGASSLQEKNISRNGSHSNAAVLDSANQAAVAKDTGNANTSIGAASEAEGTGTVVEQDGQVKKKPNVALRFWLNVKKALFHSWVNVLLIFVPVGIAVAQVPNLSPAIVFAMNAIAIIPLAGLLSHATESVARKLGDAIGALLNVTFGNAVELIIFIIALVKDEIRIVQASLLGSILANLLLILGMAFFLGGLRFREQIYNSTVTQMSACLLSLSVISLVLPTAFHASFSNNDMADTQSLKISRGTSVILLLVYIIYLLFQLKSHSYMYESTPQHIIDEESTPGPAAAWLDTSSSESSSSSDSDSDGSSQSGNTVSKRVRRAIRNRRRRKSSVASADTDANTASLGTNNASPLAEGSKSSDSTGHGFFPRPNTGGSEEAIEEEPSKRHGKRKHKHSKRKHHRRRTNSTPLDDADEKAVSSPPSENVVGLVLGGNIGNANSNGEPRRVDFADNVGGFDGNVESNVEGGAAGGKRPFKNVRGLSFRPVRNIAPPVFTRNAQDLPTPAGGSVPRVRYGIRRTNSLPGRLNEMQYRAPGALMPSQIPSAALAENAADAEIHEDDMSRTAAVGMLLISTALVAVCAEFMVNSIDGLVDNSPLGETFIGLIILPIVGNAAEHVTAVTVAMKNKMDLCIGVAVGSSIQIAIFVTPLVVILGWIMDRDMTLYFTLFETVCLFVSTFIVNFLVLDGRSNYLEGALLCATYVIIAVVAFYYPAEDQASAWGQ